MSEIVNSMYEAFNFISENVRWKISEHDVAEFIRGRFDRAGLITDEGPSCRLQLKLIRSSLRPHTRRSSHHPKRRLAFDRRMGETPID